MDEYVDTETLLALLSSLLDVPAEQSILLEALAECNGDVGRAANILNSRPSTSNHGSRSHSVPTRKWKRTIGLDGWVQRSPSKKRANSDSPEKGELEKRRALSHTDVAKDSSFSFRATMPLGDVPDVAHQRQPVPPSETSPSRVKPLSKQEFLSALRPPDSREKRKAIPPKHPPLTLSTPELVSKHTPCTLHASILPPELACRLFYTMVDLSRKWDRNRWFLFERLVESPHKTCFFVREQGEWSDEIQEATRFWYNGVAKESTPVFPPAMEEACKYIERVVNEEMHKRTRFPLEWGGETPKSSDEDFAPEGGKKIIWRANVAASNCYEGAKETVGFHTDALTYLGPYPTIASLSLGTSRMFRLREVIPSDEKETRNARTFNIPVTHNSLTIMHASCQEIFKHSVPPQRTIDLFHPPFPPPPDLKHAVPGQSDSDTITGTHSGSNIRINITFRFYRPDFRPSTTPKCKCGVPCILRPDMKNRYTCDGASSPNGAENPGSDGGKPASTRRNAVAKYWWTCHAGAQNEGKGCGMWKVMDAKAEGRGPFAADV